jgi:hypothetical protein
MEILIENIAVLSSHVLLKKCVLRTDIHTLKEENMFSKELYLLGYDAV